MKTQRPPPTMPPLPARQPIRLQILQQRRRKQQQEEENNDWGQPQSELHLPPINSDRRVTLTSIQSQSEPPPRFDHVLNTNASTTLPPLLL